jgi:exopolyphosphatase/guanosine-5'-triphosphate,3'-diphosphate pyrophosphatase
MVADEAVVSWQLGRPARPFRRVALRCAYGFPAVVEQPPYGPDGAPFPTTYYLTCPWLAAAIARIEAKGGVERWSREAAADPGLRASLERADEEQRRIRPELDVGIAGTRNPLKLKCLHAHAAFALARPGYELGERILEEVDERWCPDRRCALAAAGE